MNHIDCGFYKYNENALRDVMRYLMILMCTATMAGCASTGSETNLWNKWFAQDKAPKKTLIENNSTLPDVDFGKELGLTDKYFLGKFTIGSWVNQKPGQLYQPVNIRHPDAAIVYFYRTDSRWNRAEIVAPNFFLNGERIPSLLNNHYYWIELPAGTYRLSTSRPVALAHFQDPKIADFSVEAGQSYYLRYEEQKFRGSPDASLGLLKAGPFMQVTTEQGREEIRSTQLKSPGLSFVKYDDIKQVTVLSENIHDQKYQSVNKNQLSDKPHPVLKKPFSLVDPRTW